MPDYNMAIALIWAKALEEIYETSPLLPESLSKVSKRAMLVNTLDIPKFVNCLVYDCLEELSDEARYSCFKMLARISEEFMPETDEVDRTVISLRLWSGCLLAAKTIALQTMEGPITPGMREYYSRDIDLEARIDPVFRAGVESGIAFKRLRREKYSFRGLPERCFIKSKISFLDKTLKPSQTRSVGVSRIRSMKYTNNVKEQPL